MESKRSIQKKGNKEKKKRGSRWCGGWGWRGGGGPSECDGEAGDGCCGDLAMLHSRAQDTREEKCFLKHISFFFLCIYFN